MRQLGLIGCKSNTKFIPQEYLVNAPDARLAVLQGLLDSDGGPVTQRDRTCRIQFTTVSDRLRDDVKFLVQSLGGVVYHRTRKAEGRKPGLAGGREVHHRSDAHILEIRLPEGLAPFRLARKAAKYDATGGGRPMRYIDRIEPAGTEEAVCIRVGNADSLYVTEDFLLTHNTLNDAFIILDEAQNTTPEQMKMFLTRLGFGSKIVVTGDVTQVDLPGGATSGLRAAVGILDGIDDIHVAELTSADVVRHQLVSEIVDAYARAEESSLSMNRAQRRAHRTTLMTIEVSNESGLDVSEDELISVARFVIDKMNVHPAAELSMVLLDLNSMADLHMRWMDLPGPTDVMSFPMDELEPGGRPDAPEPGPAMLGDIVLCPEFAAEQAAAAGTFAGTRAGAAHRARCAASARLRPCRAGRREGDVRAAAPSCSRSGSPSRCRRTSRTDRPRKTVGCSTSRGTSTNRDRLQRAGGRDRADRAGRIVRGHRRRTQHGVDGTGRRAGARRAAGCRPAGPGDGRAAALRQSDCAAAHYLRGGRDGAAGRLPVGRPRPEVGSGGRRGADGGDQLRRDRGRPAHPRSPARLLDRAGVRCSAASHFGAADPDQPAADAARQCADPRPGLSQRSVRVGDRAARGGRTWRSSAAWWPTTSAG